MERVFYYSGYRLRVFHWDKNRYVASYAFNPGEEGLENFSKYLNSTENVPARILVDVIEEDFKKETVPHVGSKDRKAILRRNIERQYRGSKDYFFHRVINRESEGRRDDNLLVGVLTSPDILQPWMKVIEDAKIAIIGIWSLPLIAEKLIKKINSDDDNILLVSQQVPSNLRQSFFKKGEFQSSRSAVVNLEETPLAEYISDEVEQTIRFLANQRYIGFDEKLAVHIICRHSDIDKIKKICQDSLLRSFTYHSLEELQQQAGCGDITREYSNGLYSYICKKQIIPQGHYGPSSMFRYYYQYLTSKLLYASSFILAIASIIFMLSYIADARIMEQEIQVINQHAAAVEKEYQRKLQKLETKLAETEAMKSSVLLSEKIIKSRLVSPQNFMVDISRVFTLSGMNDTEITEINWRSTQAEKINETGSQSAGKLNYGSAEEIRQIANIRGYIRVSDSGLKKSVKKITSIIDAFKSHGMIKQVIVSKMPLDMRSKNSLENEGGTDVDKSSARDADKGEFELRLLMNGRKA